MNFENRGVCLSTFVSPLVHLEFFQYSSKALIINSMGIMTPIGKSFAYISMTKGG